MNFSLHIKIRQIIKSKKLEMSSIVDNIKRNKRSNKRNLDHWINWCIRNCEANNQKIRKNLYQILTELKIPKLYHVSLLNTIYRHDFDATIFINKIHSKSNGNFDIFNDKLIHDSVRVCLSVFHEMNMLPDSFQPFQKVGLCVLTQFVLISGRKDLQEFGVVDNLIKKWKKTTVKKNGIPIVEVPIVSINFAEGKSDEIKIVNENVLDNWDD